MTYLFERDTHVYKYQLFIIIISINYHVYIYKVGRYDDTKQFQERRKENKERREREKKERERKKKNNKKKTFGPNFIYERK